MAEDDRAWIKDNLRRSSFGSFAVRKRQVKRKLREAEKPVPGKPKDRDDGGSGAPQGRSMVRH
jgi:hypothetical protein